MAPVPDAKYLGHLHNAHLLSNCILPQSVLVLIIKPFAVLPVLGNLDPVLVSTLSVSIVSFLDQRNDSVPLLEDVGDPPIEGRLMINFS